MSFYESDFDYGPLFEFALEDLYRADLHQNLDDFDNGLTSNLWPSIPIADIPSSLLSSNQFTPPSPIPVPTTLLSLFADHAAPPSHGVSDLFGTYGSYLTPPKSLASSITPTDAQIPHSSSAYEGTPQTTETAVYWDPSVLDNQAGTAINIRALILEYCERQKLPLISEGPGMNLFPVTMMGSHIALQTLASLDQRGSVSADDFQLNDTLVRVSNPTSEYLSAIQPGLFSSSKPPNLLDGQLRPISPLCSNGMESQSGIIDVTNQIQPLNVENQKKRKRPTQQTDLSQRKKLEYRQPSQVEHSTDGKTGTEIRTPPIQNLYKEIPCKWGLNQSDTTLPNSEVVAAEGCGKLLAENISAFKLREHLRLHHGFPKMGHKGKTRCLWKECTRVPEQFTRHVLSHVKKEICPGCKKRFANSFSLQRHMRTETFAKCLRSPISNLLKRQQLIP